MLKIDNADDLLQHLKPRAVECLEIGARRTGPQPSAATVTFDLTMTPSFRVRDGEGIDVRITIHGEASFFEATADMAVLFDFTDELEVSDEAAGAFMAGRGAELTYPYAKEAFEQVIARIGLPAQLPLAPVLTAEA